MRVLLRGLPFLLPALSAFAQVPEITVIGTNQRDDAMVITPGVSAAPTPDSMEIIARLPGANVNRNGPLSGQAQYRGLFGPRINVRVDDMQVTPGGLNWMDSPMHYLPPGLANNVTMTRGIAPVSSGPGIGGLIEAQSKRTDFSGERQLGVNGDVVLSAMSNDGYAASGLIGAGNRNHRFQMSGSYEDGDDQQFGGGTIGATRYERATWGLGYGYRWNDSELSIDYTHTDTGLTGTPALPLDIDFFDTNRLNLGLNTEIGPATLSARLFFTQVDHGMNNFQLRTPPDNSQLPLPPFLDEERRTVDVEGDAVGFSLRGDFDGLGGRLSFGIDGNFEEHSGLVRDPDVPPFFVRNFNNAAQNNLGLFAEWQGEIASRWDLMVGLRYQRTESDADEVDAQPAQLCDIGAFPPGSPPCAVASLRDRFNEADRKGTDDNVDAVIRLDYALADSLTLGLGYGRKTRPASYIERYLWIPLEVNAGLGDLNNYVGNPELNSEVSNQVEVSLEWSGESGYFSPRIFFRRVDDFIQGTASTDPLVIGVSGGANGDATPLEFTNTDAELYGVDAAFGYQWSDSWRVDGTVNYVRGTNRSLDDNLYRIAPLNGRLAVTYSASSWSLTLEGVAAARQDRLSRAIVLDEARSSNAETPGWGILNLYADWRTPVGIQLRAGVENLLDRNYTNHVSGFNRVQPSDVAFGARLPGTGINGFIQLAYAW